MPKIYLVGGAVRDKLLGKDPKDKDYLIVGATAADEAKMVAEGYERVGADFPVYLHPVTKDEYAFARIERKTAPGHQGFAFETAGVTVEQDLARRDLTINSMAIDLETNELIDPYGGRSDLKKRILRHTTEAFAEDPLRVFRVAKFASRYNFRVAKETVALMKQIVKSGEIAHLAKERIWQEMEAIFGNTYAASGVALLQKCGITRFFSPYMSLRLGDSGMDMKTVRAFDTVSSDPAEKIGWLIGVCMPPTMPDKEFDAHLNDMRMPNHAKKMAQVFKSGFGKMHAERYLECSELEVLKIVKTLDFSGATSFNSRFRFYVEAYSQISGASKELIDYTFDLYRLYASELATIDRAAISAVYTVGNVINGKPDGAAIRDAITEAEVEAVKRVREMSN